MSDRLTKFNEETGEYEYRERAKTQEEFIAQRKAVIQRLGEYEDKASDLAEEIFAEIEEELDHWGALVEQDNSDYGELVELVLEDIICVIAELKKKYTQQE